MKSVSEPRNHSPFPGAFGEFVPSLPASPVSVVQPATQEHIQPEHEWQHLVCELAPLAYINFDIHGRILDFNPAAALLLGASRKHDIHRPLEDFFSSRHRRRLLKHVQQSSTSHTPVVTRRLLLNAQKDPIAGAEVEMRTLPTSEALRFRTQLIPISGNTPIARPADDAKFRALVENSSEVICIGSPDGTIFYTTPSVQRVLGYDPASWFGRNAFDVMPQDQVPILRTTVRQLASSPTGTVLRLVTQVRHFDGSWKWVEATLTNLIAEPAVAGIVCNYRDITDSRRAELAIRSNEQRYRLLAEALPQMITISDEKGKIEYCNSHWHEYRGINRIETVTDDWKNGIPEEDLPALMDQSRNNTASKPWAAECRIRRASDGALRWHSVRVVPLPAQVDAPPRWLAIGSDIHERKEAEQERERLLSHLEIERSELAVQYAVVRVFAESTSLAEVAPRLLAAFCDQLGWQAGTLWTVGPVAGADPTRRGLSLVHIRQQPDVAPLGLLSQSKPTPLRKGQGLAGRVWAEKRPISLPRLSPHRGATHHRAAARLGLHRAFAFPILLADEVHGVVELFTRNTFEPGKRLLDLVATFGIHIGLFMQRIRALDLLRQSEEAIIQVNNALEQRVRSRTAELHEANRELSAEITERTRLEREIIRISEREQRRIGQDLHDGLCQELTAIAFMTRALATRLSKSGPQEKSEASQTASETPRINHIAQLLNDSVSRCRDIARGLHPVEMDSNGLMVALNDLAIRTHQTIACSFRCNQPILMPESDMALNLYRIAQEAVNNAVKYSRANRITISLDRDGSATRLSISDDGRGIPARSISPRRTRGGMGLHIMRYRARTMGATLRIHDRKPHGTEVVCLLSA